MDILLVAPGPTVSTFDAYAGLLFGLSRAGARVRPFHLHNRLYFMKKGMEAVGKDLEMEHTMADVVKWTTQMVIGEALWPKPADWVLFVSGTTVDPLVYPALKNIRRVLGRPKVAVYLTECPYMVNEQEEIASWSDAVFVNDKGSLAQYQGVNPHTFYLPHSYNPLVHFPRPVGEEYRSDVLFIGTMYPERVALLSQVDWTGIHLRLMGYWPEEDPHSPIYPFWKDGAVPNRETAKYYCGAKIVLNMHRRSLARQSGPYQLKLSGEVEPGLAKSVNPRCFEVPACGSFLLTDYREELEELFVIGRDIEVFDGPEDLERKVRHYLAHEEERLQVAFNGWTAVRPYSFIDRAREVLRRLEEVERYG